MTTDLLFTSDSIQELNAWQPSSYIIWWMLLLYKCILIYVLFQVCILSYKKSRIKNQTKMKKSKIEIVMKNQSQTIPKVYQSFDILNKLVGHP